MEGDFSHFRKDCKLTRQKRLVEVQEELVRHQYNLFERNCERKICSNSR